MSFHALLVIDVYGKRLKVMSTIHFKENSSQILTFLAILKLLIEISFQSDKSCERFPNEILA